MKRLLVLLVACATMMTGIAAQAMDVYLYMDTAPNAYGSPLFAEWKSSAFEAAAGGTFVNMRSGMYAGTTFFDATEAIVYSTGDLGKRLHWIYWIPEETVESLAGRFEAKDAFDWGGEALTLDSSYNYIADGSEAGWFTPGSWVNYNGGVIGTFGDAWWATDNDALPFSTVGNDYDETNAADVAALADQMRAYQTYWYGEVRFRDTVDGEWQNLRVTGNVAVPEPMSVMLGVLGLSSVAGFRRLRRK